VYFSIVFRIVGHVSKNKYCPYKISTSGRHNYNIIHALVYSTQRWVTNTLYGCLLVYLNTCKKRTCNSLLLLLLLYFFVQAKAQDFRRSNAQIKLLLVNLSSGTNDKNDNRIIIILRRTVG